MICRENALYDVKCRPYLVGSASSSNTAFGILTTFLITGLLTVLNSPQLIVIWMWKIVFFFYFQITQATISGIDAKFASSAIDDMWLRYRKLANHQELNPGPCLSCQQSVTEQQVYLTTTYSQKILYCIERIYSTLLYILMERIFWLTPIIVHACTALCHCEDQQSLVVWWLYSSVVEHWQLKAGASEFQVTSVVAVR